MKIIDFKGSNVVYAKDQPEYLSLPAYKAKDGIVTSCWKLSFLERIMIAFTGRLFLQVMTFNAPLQPIRMEVGKFKIDKEVEDESV